jgi:beta-lactamase superfamily II metal-dependent hydrolase
MKIKFLKAENGDSILISFLDNDGNPRNILIDGGTEATYFSRTKRAGFLKKEIEEIKLRGEVIDLLVLSHIDNDHIEGLLKWFELDNEASDKISEVWFNSGKAIAKYLKEPKNEDLSLFLKIGSNVFTGVDEGIEFENFLRKHKLVKDGVIKKNFRWEGFGLTIQVLTPTDKQLKKLLKLYHKETGDLAYTSRKEKDWGKNISDLIFEESQPSFKFKQDDSEKNGSSISSLITFKGKKFLLLADSHPKTVIKSLEELGYSKTNPVEVEFMQVSHHGSKANNNKEIFDLIETNNYIVSTNSSAHGHPHKSTIARIVAKNPSATIHFNYEFVHDNILTVKDKTDYPELKLKSISEVDIN